MEKMMAEEAAESGGHSSVGVPWDYHNLFVLVVALATAVWVAKVLYQIGAAVVLQRSLASARPLPLYGMSLYMEDLQLIIRQHFNQILRMRRTVAPRKVNRHAVSAHLRPESLDSFEESGRLGVQFVVDALAPSAVRLYWGVSEAACQAFMQQHQGQQPEVAEGLSAAVQPLLSPSRRGMVTLNSPTEVEDGLRRGGASPTGGRLQQLELGGRHLFAAGSCAASSVSTRLPQGLGQVYRTPSESTVDPNALGFELSRPPLSDSSDGSLVPLVIAVTAKPRTSSEEDRLPSVGDTPVIEAHSELTLVKFGRSDSSASTMKAEVLHQVIFGAEGAQRIMGIFGFEGEHQPDSDMWDCQICYDRPKSVLLLPCRHCSVCELCLRSLRDERCPLCRATFSAYLLLPLHRPQDARPAEAGRSFAA